MPAPIRRTIQRSASVGLLMLGLLAVASAQASARAPGAPAARAADHPVCVAICWPGSPVARGLRSSDGSTSRAAAPAISTNASVDIVLGGGTLSDAATVTGLVSPDGGASIVFRLYGPDDATCSGAPAFTPAPVAYPVAGGPVSSPTFTPTQAGTYRWIATYTGDVNNPPVAGACNDANESTVVSKANPTITTQASATVALGAGPLTDSITVVGRVNPQPGAAVGFILYGPDDPTCGTTPAFAPAPVDYPVAGGPVTSPAFTPTQPGTYRWIAIYGGDANNTAVIGACNDANESTVVTRAAPTLTTTASADTALGGEPLTDSATITGRVNPQAGATILFRLYGPDDATCSGAPAFSPAPVAYPEAGGAVTSPAFTPTQPGTYRWVASYSGDPNNLPAGGACNDSGESTVVSRAPTAITTLASPDIALGAGSLTDNATVTGRVSPDGGGSITFRLYGPGDVTCSGAPAFSPAPVAYPQAGGAVTSPAFTPTQAGTYRWIATYGGDASNAPASGTCDAPSETTVVTRSPTAITTSASPGLALGAGTLTDSATVTGRVNPQAGATITFRLYGPNDATCIGTPAFSPAPVAYPDAGGAVTSPAFTPTQAGTYRWIAAYSGDSNNLPIGGACNDPNETATVTVAVTPSLTTSASPGVRLGAGPLTDTATVSGRVSPSPGATITFRLYGPGDATCSGPIALTSTVPYPVAGGAVTSGPFTPTQPGIHRWVAAYSGDVNNAGISGACNDANESTAVAKAATTIATTASPAIRVGAGSLTDSAVVGGRVGPQPGATVAFALYGANDATCSGTPASTSTVGYPVAGGTVASAAFTPTLAGTYRWIASYSGDANNDAATGQCADPGESTVVSPAAITPPPPPPPPPPPARAPRCHGKVATIVPRAGQTVITATTRDDVIVGTSASERIDGRGGNDTICAGAGNDRVRGSAGNDLLLGEAGNDLVIGGAGTDDVRGEAGRDRVAGGNGRDRVDGGAGNDRLDEKTLGGGGRDRLFGGAGIDSIRADDRTIDAVDCGAARDTAVLDRRDRAIRCERVRRVPPPSA